MLNCLMCPALRSQAFAERSRVMPVFLNASPFELGGLFLRLDPNYATVRDVWEALWDGRRVGTTLQSRVGSQDN